jgi:hypothetical protein
MDQKIIFIIPTNTILRDDKYKKLFYHKTLFPLGLRIGFMSTKTELLMKVEGSDEKIYFDDKSTIIEHKGQFFIHMGNEIFKRIEEKIGDQEDQYIFLVAEGAPDRIRIAYIFQNKGEDTIFSEIEKEDPTVRFEAFGLPSNSIEIVEPPQIINAIYSFLSREHNEVLSVHANRFLKSPHILTHLFSQVQTLKSEDNIGHISTLRVLSENLRELLRPYKHKMAKNHQEAWSHYYGKKVSFVDEGMSRIISLPRTEPMGIRIGIYSVIPGETNIEKRESWDLFSFVIGDILGEKPKSANEVFQTDVKRLQEAARFILEPLIALNYAYKDPRPEIVVMHGPLQNKFEVYDSLPPNYIPRFNEDFLDSQGMRKEDVEADISRGLPWNECIPIYAYLMKRIFSSHIPFVGVVERSSSSMVIEGCINKLVENNEISASSGRKIKEKIGKYEYSDEYLFGCILDEGEYLTPIPIKKSQPNRAHDDWQSIIERIPSPWVTMVKCTADNFPFRIELNSFHSPEKLRDIMLLIYHTSLLLPYYAFPVGIDIVDKYAKIPDWLSKGISANLSAYILYKAVQTGDERLVMQIRKKLARSPRDFFFRPKP